MFTIIFCGCNKNNLVIEKNAITVINKNRINGVAIEELTATTKEEIYLVLNFELKNVSLNYFAESKISFNSVPPEFEVVVESRQSSKNEFYSNPFVVPKMGHSNQQRFQIQLNNMSKLKLKYSNVVIEILITRNKSNEITSIEKKIILDKNIKKDVLEILNLKVSKKIITKMKVNFNLKSNDVSYKSTERYKIKFKYLNKYGLEILNRESNVYGENFTVSSIWDDDLPPIKNGELRRCEYITELPIGTKLIKCFGDTFEFECKVN